MPPLRQKPLSPQPLRDGPPHGLSLLSLNHTSQSPVGSAWLRPLHPAEEEEQVQNLGPGTHRCWVARVPGLYKALGALGLALGRGPW